MSSASVIQREPDDSGTARRFAGNSWASASASPSGFPVNTWASSAAVSPNDHFGLDSKPSIASSASARPPNATNSWTSATASSNGWVDRPDGVIGEVWQPGGVHVPVNVDRPTDHVWGSAASNGWVDRPDGVIGEVWQPGGVHVPVNVDRPTDHVWGSAASNGWVDRPNGVIGEIWQPGGVHVPVNVPGDSIGGVWGSTPSRPGLPGGSKLPPSSVAVSANATLLPPAGGWGSASVVSDEGPDSTDPPNDTEYRILGVTFDLGRGRVTGRQPLAQSVQVLENGTNDSQQMGIDFNESVTHTSNFEQTAGVSISAGVSFSVGLPFVAGGETSFSVTGSYEHTWGEEHSTTQEWSAKFPLNVGPHKTYRAISSVIGGTLSVPYTMTVVRPRRLAGRPNAREPDHQGIWTGITSWELRHQVIDETTGTVVANF